MSRYGGRAIYVGNLPEGTRNKELEEIFHKFGRIRMVDIKTPPRPPGYAFVEFEDARDAQEAARRRDGYEFGGSRLRVEVAKGGNETQSAPRAAYRAPRGAAGYRILIKGLPKSASWQDLKDHFRRVVKPMYTEVMRDATGGGVTGIVEFETKDDMRLAIRKLDDTEFKNPFDDKCYIRLEEDTGERGGGGSRGGGGGYDDRGRGGDRNDRYNDRGGGGGRDDDRGDRGRERERSRSREPARREEDRPTRGRDSRSRSRSASRSPAPKAGSRSPERKSSRSPVRKSSRSPERKASRSPERKQSRSPERKSRDHSMDSRDRKMEDAPHGDADVKHEDNDA